MTTDRVREKVARAIFAARHQKVVGQVSERHIDIGWVGVTSEADAAISVHTKALHEELQQPFAAVFLDGRNEHGSHVLPMPGDNLGCLHKQAIDLLSDQSVEYAERIISEAEGLGHRIGHCVITTWRICSDGPGEPWVELAGVSQTLTALFFGSPQKQDEELAAAAQHTKGEGDV